MNKNLTSIKGIQLLGWILGFICITTVLQAQVSVDIDQHLKFREATGLFGDSQDYQGALDKFLELENEKGLTPNLAFNIASCYYKLGKYGNSRLFLERAKLMSPHNPDVQNNLKVILKKLNLEEPKPSGIDELSGKLSSNQWFWLGLSLVTFPFFYLFVDRTIRAFWSQQSSITLGYYVMLAICLFSGGSFLYLSMHNSKLTECGITIIEDATLRQSPFDQSEPIATIREGRKLQILKMHEGFFLCIDGEASVKGWISKNEFLPVVE